MNKQGWLFVGKSLPVGQFTRLPCCAQDNSMRVSNERNGIRGFCFRCGLSVFESHGERSIAALAEARKAQNSITTAGISMRLPDDFVTITSPNVPASARAWLLKSSVGLSIAEHYGIGWSEKLQRVMIPIYSPHAHYSGNENLRIIQGRSIDPRLKPKYLNLRGHSSQGVLFHPLPQLRLPDWTDPCPGSVVILEDVMSAIRVGRISSAVSILGTAMPSEKADTIRQLGKTPVVWLDGDRPGKKASQRLITTFELMGLSPRLVVSAKDPKLYTNKQIWETLNSA